MRPGAFIALCCALAAPVRAQPAPAVAPPAPAATAHPPAAAVSVWYRSSEGCPDGASFLARLGQLGRTAALAGVGDRVDFVVTLAARSEVSAGRLERQTERGTVAIREVESPACADVAEALALSLELALEPAAAGSATSATGVSAAALPAPEAAREPPADRPAEPAAERALRAKLALGAQGRLGLGLGPQLTPGAALFAELVPRGWPSAARLGVHGAYAESEARSTNVRVLLLAAELDACAWRWQLGALSLEPCAGADLGLLQASSDGARGNDDRGLWASARGLLRSRWALSASLQPELQLGLVVPFTRYVFGAPEGDDLFRVSAVGGELSVGARWAP